MSPVLRPSAGRPPMSPTLGGGAAAALRRELEDISRQRRQLTLREEAIWQELSALEAAGEQAQPDAPAAPVDAPAAAEDEAATSEAACGGAASLEASLALERFWADLAWAPSHARLPLECEEVVRRRAAVPVTLYCAFDPASRAAAGELSRLLKDSRRVRLRVRRFGADDPCGMEDVLTEDVVLLCIHCSGDEGEADTLYARTLSKKLHQAGKGWSQRTGKAPGGFAAMGYGHMDPYVMLYRNSRGDSGLVSEALEALGSTPLLRHQYVDEKVPGGVAFAAEQWARRAAQKVDDWARGGWSPEPEKLKGPEWTFDEITRWEFVVNRRGMQDG